VNFSVSYKTRDNLVRDGSYAVSRYRADQYNRGFAAYS